jgi:hypothetical protein
MPILPTSKAHRKRRAKVEAPPTDPAKKHKPKRGKTVSPALSKIAERALTATPEQIRAYIPTEMTMQIAEAMLGGEITYGDIARSVGVCSDTIGKAMKDPVACAWISEKVHQAISTRLGLIDAALMNRAVAGDVRAAELIFKRYDKLVSRSMNLNLSGAVNFDKMSDDDLARILDAETARESPRKDT